MRVLLNSARKVCGRLRIPQEGESARALYKRHTRERIPATRRYSFEKRPPVDKSANLASLLWRYAPRDSDVDLRNSLFLGFISLVPKSARPNLRSLMNN